MALEAAAPLGNGVGVATELSGDEVVARDAGLWPGGAQEDESGAEGQGLGRGVGVGQGAELLDFGRGQGEDG